MAVSLTTRRLLAQLLAELEVDPQKVEGALRGGANLLETLSEQVGGQEKLKDFLRKVLPENFLDISREEIPHWRPRLFLVEKDYALFSMSEEKVGALIPRLPYDAVHEAIEEAHGFLVHPYVVFPETFALLASDPFEEEKSAEGSEEKPSAEEPPSPPGKQEELAVGLGRLTGLFGTPSHKRLEDIAELPPIDEAVARTIPKEVAVKLGTVPLLEESGHVLVATVNPRNLVALDSMTMVFRKRVEVVEVSEVVLQALLDRVYENKPFAPNPAEEEVKEEETPSLGEETEARKLVYRMIREAVYLGASDIHMEPQRGEVLVRFRVDGILREWTRIGRAGYAPVVSVVKLMSGMDISERRLPQDGRLRHRISPREMADFRVSTVPATYGERVVMRLLRSAEDIPELEALGFLPDTLEAFKAVISRPYGLILVTGPTGSGKSFTNFSVLKRISGPEKNVLTVEDPVEYEIPGISQIQVKSNIGLTFARVLRAFLRQDPDVIMVGEIRDAETAKIATEAALTGHLVLATLHTNDAAQAVTRLEEMGVERYNIAASLLAVLSQRLARKLCSCKVPSSPEQVDFYRGVYREAGVELPERAAFYEPNGCPKCGGTGYKGRMPIHELLVVRETTRQAILELKAASALKEQAVRESMRTLRQDGLLKAAQGLTSVQEVLQRTIE